MKKLTLLMAALFLAGFTFAQNTATTTVTGNNNNSDIDQTGDTQVATVTQDGNYNDSDVDQYAESSSYGPGEQTATVYQEGDRNEAQIDMDQTGGGGKTPNTAYIEQLGNWNDSYQKVYTPGSNSGAHEWGKQEGNHNDLIQIVDEGYTKSLKSTQTGDFNIADQRSIGGAYHTFVIETDGDRNEAYQKSISTKANLKIDQDGNYNYAKQDFQGSFGFVPGNSGLITQDGSYNDAYQYMTSGKQGNDMDLLQDGDGNYSYQRLAGNDNKTDFEIWGNYNDTYGYQTGDDHEATIDMWGDRNYAKIDQKGGDDNGASLWTTGDWNDFYMTQDGEDNSMRVESGGDHNYVKFVQKQDDNKAYLNMRGTGPGTNGRPISAHNSDYNDVRLTQDGEDNLFSGYVAGDRNDLDITQSGDYNTIGTGMWNADGVNVWGNYNDVDVHQSGMGHDATVNVTGSWNVSSTTQN